jgi:hypothetical protein
LEDSFQQEIPSLYKAYIEMESFFTYNNCIKGATLKPVIYLCAMELVEEAAYGDFARTVAVIINENNEQVKKRLKKSEAVEQPQAEE